MGCSKRRRGSAFRGLPLALVALALLAAGIVRTAHEILVPHRVCQVHGTLEHGSASVAAADEAVRDGLPRLAPWAAAHEECELAPFTRTEPLLAPAPQPGLDLRLEARRAPLPPCVPPPRSALFRRSPSRSPPA